MTSRGQERRQAVHAAARAIDVPVVELRYDRTIGERVDALARSLPAEVIVLLPGRVDTRWFRRLPYRRWCALTGRLSFGDTRGSAPFPSAAQYIGSRPDEFSRAFQALRLVYERWSTP